MIICYLHCEQQHVPYTHTLEKSVGQHYLQRHRAARYAYNAYLKFRLYQIGQYFDTQPPIISPIEPILNARNRVWTHSEMINLFLNEATDS